VAHRNGAGHTDAANAVDGLFADALDPTNGEFLMPLLGVLEEAHWAQ
jgi:hypothetical protein